MKKWRISKEASGWTLREPGGKMMGMIYFADIGTGKTWKNWQDVLATFCYQMKELLK